MVIYFLCVYVQYGNRSMVSFVVGRWLFGRSLSEIRLIRYWPLVSLTVVRIYIFSHDLGDGSFILKNKGNGIWTRKHPNHTWPHPQLRPHPNHIKIPQKSRKTQWKKCQRKEKAHKKERQEKNQIKSHLINNVSHHQNFIGHESRIMYLFLFNTSVSGLSQNLFRFWLSLHKKWVRDTFLLYAFWVYTTKNDKDIKNYYIMDALRKKN